MSFAQIIQILSGGPLPHVAGVPPDGWPALLLQAGSFGLLSILVVYIGPKFFKELRHEREARETRFESMLILLQSKFEERNTAVVAAIKSQTDSWVQEIRRQASEIKEAIKNGNGGGK